MVAGTRRKSKRVAQPTVSEAEVDGDAASSGGRPSPGPGPSKFSLGSLPSDVSFTALSELLPDVSFESPSPETIIHCYKLVLEQHEQISNFQRDLEDLRAEAERKDVELDQALQDRESAVREMEGAVETAQNELKLAKLEKDEIAASRDALQSQLSAMSSSHSTSSSEVESLRRRTEDREREKRDLMVVVSRLKDDAAQREEEVQTLRDNLKKSRKEHQDLESENRELRSKDTATKFRLDTLTQQLQLSSGETERLNEELSEKVQEFSTYRREKHTEVAQLQAALDSVTLAQNQTSNTLRNLQSSHAAQERELSQSLQKVQDLTGQLADQEAKYSSETSNLRRLVQMMEEREAQAKALVEGIEKDWDGLGAKAAARERELRNQLNEEQQRVEMLEKQLEDMQLVMEKINRGELPLPSSGERSNRATSSLMEFSPSLNMISRMQKSGKTFTEVYADYVRLQEELARKNIEYDRMDRTLSDVLAQIEERAPILAEQRREHERLQAEAFQLASQLTQSLSERDNHASRYREIEQIYVKSEKDNSLLQQQLDDLGRQVQTLLRELGRRDDSSLPADEEMESVAPAENIEQVITNNLVLFRSIPELQTQNQKLLKITRDLGAKLEAEEREYKETLDQEQTEAIREAHEAIQTLQMQLEVQQKSQQSTIQAYAKERDTLKTMLARYEKNVGSSSTSHASGPPQLNGHTPTLPSSDIAGELHEVQTSFDAYRHEIGIDTIKLREEALNYQREANQLGAALAKANAKIEYLNDRQRMAQEQYAIRTRDYDSLSKRNQQLYDQYTRLDIACNHANEELLAANGQIERLRNETANLRAEKRVWAGVQERLVNENATLSIERSRLSDLMTNFQKMHNDIERSGESDRRRLETLVQTLESQADDLRAQLSQERDTVRQVTLQKDIETQELRARLDRTTEELAKARESLVGFETSQKHMQERLDDLAKQVQRSDAKLSVYEHRSTPMNNVTSSSEEGVSQEKQLESEVAELRGALKAAEVDLAAARSHVEQYRDISQASEAALTSLNATLDQYKADTEAEIARRESQERALQEKLEALEQDMVRLSDKNSDLSKTLETERAVFASDKKTLEDTIVDITNAEMSSRSDQTSRQSEVHQLEERAKAAEEKYGQEVLAHADSIKAVKQLKEELSTVRVTIREAHVAADTAKAKLSTSEESWKHQKESLDKECADLRTRCDDLTAQNTLLHQHLENVSLQASRIRQAADSVTINASMDGADDGDVKLAELRSVVGYLRKEKEIVDLQLELSKQENSRLKTKIDHLSHSLEEARVTLTAERERAAESLENSSQHAELLEKINQHNILRESNATLRAESEAHSRRARQLEAQLQKLTSELDPIKEELRVTRAELGEKDRQLGRLEGENRQWKDRNTELLTKYDRIDPHDVQTLRDTIDDLQIDVNKYEHEKQKAAQETESQGKKFQELTSELTTLQNKYETQSLQIQQMRHQLGGLNGTNGDLRKQVKELTQERDNLVKQASSVNADSSTAVTNYNAQIATLNATVETLTEEKAVIEKELADVRSLPVAKDDTSIAALREERDKLLAEKSSWFSSKSTSDQTPSQEQYEASKAEIQKSRDEALGRAKAAEDQLEKLTEQIRNVRAQNDKFQARLAENEQRKNAERERFDALVTSQKQETEKAIAAALEKLRSELQQPNTNSGDVAARHSEELQALESRLKAQHEQQLEARSSELKEAFIDLGRKEVSAKLQLKEKALKNAQERIKVLEAEKKASLNAQGTPSQPSATGVPKPSPLAVTPSGSTSTTTTLPSVPSPSTSSAPTAAASATLPRKPSLTAPAVANSATRGRGLPTRGRGLLGAGRGRGGVPAALNAKPSAGSPVDPASATSTPAASEMSIIGAASKRAREESGTPDSLAKRIKPAEGTSKPVALRRPQPPPPAEPSS
ncbi:hypothetical protein BD410DRAFT_789007 [Rickenella mellea]|uniref:Uncharacterized protein n=1 Tax=Rickenella mellea TaxID=50990 RepID=A0A4Y7Q4X7_9AGAM|nr:hypothetical protein BD410DRAFT_789007 [Rickenella mellea]